MISKLWHAWALLVLSASAALFYGPALERTGGAWPAPLDDVYIYFGFARSTALGHPFEHFPGNGFSSGATSIVYPFLLAPAWALGLRGTQLGIAAALLALLCLYDLSRSLCALTRGLSRWLVPLMVVAVPLVDWSWWSGMETALFGAILGRALLASQRALDAPCYLRPARQLRAGAWLALLPVTRPETLPLAVALAIAVVHGARALGTWPSLARALGPCAAALGAQALVQRTFTGEWAAAGAVRKLVFSPPYTDGAAAAVEMALNALVIGHQAFVRAVGGLLGAAVLVMLVVVAIVTRARRRLSLALVVGSAGALALVCLNTTARYQNYRYAVPCVVMLLCAATLHRHAFAGVLLLAALAARELPRQREHFAQASRNIAEQQAEVARRLAAMQPRPRRVMVGDAGAIPYLSEIPVIDGLGLGGFRGMPFARASVHGLPAVVELIERMPIDERPDVLALYPGWWPGIVDVFGRPIDRVKITGNVICGGDEKVVYAADWSALAAPHEPTGQTELDVADLVDERAHDFRFPAPYGGWIVDAILLTPEGTRRWDAGRIVPIDERVSWKLDPPRTGVLRLRSDRPARVAVLAKLADGKTWEREVLLEAGAVDHWVDAELKLFGAVSEIELRAVTTLRLHHVWIL